MPWIRRDSGRKDQLWQVILAFATVAVLGIIFLAVMSAMEVSYENRNKQLDLKFREMMLRKLEADRIQKDYDLNSDYPKGDSFTME